MFLPHDNKTQQRPLGLLRSALSGHDSHHPWDFDLIDLGKPTLGHAISVKHDPVRKSLVYMFEALKVVERASHVFDHFEAGVLNASCGDVTRVPAIDGADES